MKILIINGSPRKKGLISQMLDIMRQEAEQRGDEVQVVYTTTMELKLHSSLLIVTAVEMLHY